MIWLATFAALGLIVLWFSASFGHASKAEPIHSKLTLLRIVVSVIVLGVGINYLFTNSTLIIMDDLLMMWSMMLATIAFLGLIFTALRVGIKTKKIQWSVPLVLLALVGSGGSFYKGMSVYFETKPSYDQVLNLIDKGHRTEASRNWCYLVESKWTYQTFAKFCWSDYNWLSSSLKKSPAMRKSFLALLEPIILSDGLVLERPYANQHYRDDRKNIQRLLKIIGQIEPKWPALETHMGKEYANCQNHPTHKNACFEMLLRRWTKNGVTSHPWFQKACEGFLSSGYHKPEQQFLREKVYPRSCLPNTPLFGLTAGLHVFAQARENLQGNLRRQHLFQLAIPDWETQLASMGWFVVPFDEKHQILFNEHYQPILLVRLGKHRVVAAQILLPPRPQAQFWTQEEIQALFERLTGESLATLVRAKKKKPSLLHIQRDDQGKIESATFGKMPLNVSIQVKTLIAYHSAIRPFHRKSLGSFFYYEKLSKTRLERSYGLSAVQLMQDIHLLSFGGDWTTINMVASESASQMARNKVPVSIDVLEAAVYKPYPPPSSSSSSPTPSVFNDDDDDDEDKDKDDSNTSSFWGSPSTTTHAPSNRSSSFGSRSRSSGGYRSGKN